LPKFLKTLSEKLELKQSFELEMGFYLPMLYVLLTREVQVVWFILLLISFVTSFAQSNYCDVIGYGIYADDAGTGKVGTYLGTISTSTTDPQSILNPVGIYGSSVATKSIFNTVGQYGGCCGTYSAYNTVTSTPPRIIEYRAATNSFYFVAYLSISTFKFPNYNPDDLRSVLKFGNCAGLAPIVYYDTVRVTQHDTVIHIETLKVVQRDTIKITEHDTTRVTVRDTIIKNDTIRVVIRDTVIKKDTIKYCPPTLAKTSSVNRSPERLATVYNALGQPEWSGLLQQGAFPDFRLKEGLYIITQGTQSRRFRVSYK
jgi:hypothetical protein